MSGKPLVVGLTGGIASGKTLVAEAFEALGVPVLDADFAAREVVRPGQPALAQVTERFGREYLQADGTLDRRKLRERVFGDPAALKDLEGITHPAIREYIRHWLEAQTAPYCILSVPLLVESGALRGLTDRVLVVDVPVELQMERLKTRDTIGADLAAKMIASQATREQRLAAADEVIVNTGSPEATRQAVAGLHQRYQELCARPAAAAKPQGRDIDGLR